MTAPSFSSFPPSFSSFPEFDSDKTGARGDDKKKRKKHEHKKRHKSTRSRETSREKEREDASTNDTLVDRIFYSDRRGDFLNIQFGGLHIGDVPKYRLVDSMIQSLLCGNS